MSLPQCHLFQRNLCPPKFASTISPAAPSRRSEAAKERTHAIGRDYSPSDRPSPQSIGQNQSTGTQGWQQGGFPFSHQRAEAPLSGPLASGTAAPAQPSLRAEDNGHDALLAEEHVELYYATGWPQPTILYSVQGREWGRCAMQQVASSSGLWKCARFPLSGTATAAPLLEFVITNDGERWDKPWSGGNYAINSGGRFMMKDGEIEAVSGRSVLVVSDLDDTMVGDDAATADFKEYWESVAVPRGSRLVYNTGRSLEKWRTLIEEKEGILAPPDVLISSVGTKVYNMLDGDWVENAVYAAQLDEGWDLNVVREATYAALAAVGRDHMHFRPPEEQNDHKVTCGVAVAVLDDTLARIQESLQASGVQARLAVSGFGDWRFLDIVSIRAGKLEALEFVREQLGFEHSATLACGDSGNDIDMLGGRNLAVVVGNAQAELLRWLIKEKERSKAAGGPKRLLAATRERADGIIEALETFGFKERSGKN